MNENELMHYGVLGVKWGRRKAVRRNAVNARKKQEAKSRIVNAGGKKKAIQRVNRISTAQPTVKKGALATAAVVNGLYSTSAAVGAAKVATGSLAASYVTGVLGTFAATPVTALGFGTAALAAAGAAGATKLHQRSKKDQEKINYIKKSK